MTKFATPSSVIARQKLARVYRHLSSLEAAYDALPPKVYISIGRIKVDEFTNARAELSQKIAHAHRELGRLMSKYDIAF